MVKIKEKYSIPNAIIAEPYIKYYNISTLENNCIDDMSLYVLLASDGINDEAFTTSSLLFYIETEANLNRNNIDVHNLVKKKIVRKSRDDGSADNITVSIIKLKDINNKSYKKNLWIWSEDIKELIKEMSYTEAITKVFKKIKEIIIIYIINQVLK